MPGARDVTAATPAARPDHADTQAIPAFEASVRGIRAALVHDELCPHPELVERVEDVARLPRFALWDALVVDEAIADLVAAGTVTEAADGRLCVRPRSAT